MALTPPAPAGTPYHRMAAVAGHAWWRPIMGTLLLVALYVGLLLAVLLPPVLVVSLVPAVDQLLPGPVWETVGMLISLALIIPAVLLAARIVQRRRVGTVSSVRGRLRWGWLWRCLAVAAPAVILTVTIVTGIEVTHGTMELSREGITGGDWVGWPGFLTGAGFVLLLVPLQAAAEEYFARGWILQTFGAYLRTPWPGIVAGATVFALLHGLSELSGFVGLMWFGVMFGWLAVRTGGLEAGIAYHTVNNVIGFLVIAAFGGLGSAGDSTAADAPWSLPLVEAVVLPLYALCVLRWHRRRGYDRLAPAPESFAVRASTTSPHRGGSLAFGQPGAAAMASSDFPQGSGSRPPQP
ncbi:MAG: lysostaphin resistance A-like protein [Micromonosporaceae bacterium]